MKKQLFVYPTLIRAKVWGDKIKEVTHIMNELGNWEGIDPETGFHLVKTQEGITLRIADLVEDDATKRNKVSMALKRPEAYCTWNG
jgi:hypothetical protein